MIHLADDKCIFMVSCNKREETFMREKKTRCDF